MLMYTVSISLQGRWIQYGQIPIGNSSMMGGVTKSTTWFVARQSTDEGRCPNLCIMSLYRHGCVSLFIHSASIPPTTLLCSKINWLGIPKTSARIGRSFLWTLNSAKHSSFCMSSRSKSGYCSYGKSKLVDVFKSYKRRHSSEFRPSSNA